MSSTFVLLLFLILLSCDKNCCLTAEEARETLPGTWLLIETGHSPGHGYFTEDVPSDPPQTVTFHPDGSLSSTNLLQDFKHYKVYADTVHRGEILALYKKNRDETFDPLNPPSTYSLTIEDNRLTLSYRWCIEGCHMKFKPVKREPEL